MINTVNNKGYTLLEALVGIIVMTIIITLSMYFLSVLKINIADDYAKKEMMVFSSQIQLDFLEARDFEVLDNKVILNNYIGDEVSYLKDKNRLIRQVNESGYEIMLTKIKEVSFEKQNKLVYAHIVFEDEKEYEGVIGAIG